MKRSVLLLAFATLAACAQKDAPPPQTQASTTQTQPAPAEPAGEPSPTAALAPDVPAGDYKMDPAHSTLIFRVSHMGFSKYTARFRRFDAQLRFDPRNLTATQLTATVDPRSIETDFPDPKYNFNAELAGEQWLDAAKFPEIAFRTIRVEDLGNQAMLVLPRRWSSERCTPSCSGCDGVVSWPSSTWASRSSMRFTASRKACA